MSNKDRKIRTLYEHHTFMTTGFGKFRIIIEADFSAGTDIPKVTARAPCTASSQEHSGQGQGVRKGGETPLGACRHQIAHRLGERGGDFAQHAQQVIERGRLS